MFDRQHGLIYEAAVGEADWSSALGALSEAVGGAALFVWQGDALEPTSYEHWIHNFDGDMYLKNGFGEYDQFDLNKNRLLGRVLGARVGRPFDRCEILSDSELDRDPLLRFAAEQGIYHARFVLAARSGTRYAGAFLGLPKARGAVDVDTARQFDAWAPHLQRALRLRARLRLAERGVSRLSDMLGRLGIGVVIVDRDLKLRFSNACADEMLAVRDGIGLSAGRLMVAAPGQHRELHRRVRANASPEELPSDESLSVPRPTGLPPLALTVLPAAGLGAAAEVLDAAATVVIADPLRARELPDEAALARRFGFSAAEARVARLVPLALSKLQLAERLGLSENTVKTHLAAIRAKLGARNVGELAAILGRAGGC